MAEENKIQMEDTGKFKYRMENLKADLLQIVGNTGVRNRIETMEFCAAFWEFMDNNDVNMHKCSQLKSFVYIAGEMTQLSLKGILSWISNNETENFRYSRIDSKPFSGTLSELKELGFIDEEQIIGHVSGAIAVRLLDTTYSRSDIYIAQVLADIVKKYVEYRNDWKCLWEFVQGELVSWYSSLEYDFMRMYRNVVENELKIPSTNMLTKIAHQTYERRENDARIYFLRENQFAEAKVLFVKIDEESYLDGGFGNASNVTKIRKLFEVCHGNNSCLVAEPRQGKEGNYYDITKIIMNDDALRGQDSIVFIDFKGTGWKLHEGTDIVLMYKDGAYSVNKQKALEAECRDKELGLAESYTSIFAKIRENVPHGALIIIAEDAKHEADILCKTFQRGTRIETVQIEESNTDLLISMASIDGAVLLDEKCNCYGFGIVLDGLAKVVGDSGRGSRYNSAVNYICNSESKRWAAVFSEDKDKGIQLVYNQNLKEKTLAREYSNPSIK